MREEQRKALIADALAGELPDAQELPRDRRFAAAMARLRHGRRGRGVSAEEAAELRRLFEVGEDVSAGVPPGYEEVAEVLAAALAQTAEGKGRERHANDKPFDDQPMARITAMVGVGFPLGQVMKKAQEAGGMAQRGENAAAQAELLGVIVYAVGAYLALNE